MIDFGGPWGACSLYSLDPRHGLELEIICKLWVWNWEAPRRMIVDSAAPPPTRWIPRRQWHLFMRSFTRYWGQLATSDVYGNVDVDVAMGRMSDGCLVKRLPAWPPAILASAPATSVVLFVNERKMSTAPLKETICRCHAPDGRTRHKSSSPAECCQVDRMGWCSLQSTHLVAAQRHLAAAPGAAANVAVVANVANAVGELGLKAYVTGGIQLDASLLLLLGALSDLHFQRDHLVLLAPVGGSRVLYFKKIYIKLIEYSLPHDLVLLLLLLLLAHEDILDLHPLVGRQVRQVGHLVHGSGIWSWSRFVDVCGC